MMTKVAKKGGRAIPPGPTAKVDWERVEKEELLAGQHAYDDHELSRSQIHLAKKLKQYEEKGDFKNAAKAKRNLNYVVEGKLAIRSSWCPTCLNYLHNCQCEADDDSMKSPLVLQLIHNILAEPHLSVEEEKARAKEAKKQAAKAARKARKEA